MHNWFRSYHSIWIHLQTRWILFVDFIFTKIGQSCHNMSCWRIQAKINQKTWHKNTWLDTYCLGTCYNLNILSSSWQPTASLSLYRQSSWWNFFWAFLNWKFGCWIFKDLGTHNCQALSISQSLNLSLSLRDRDRADTIITFHPPTTENFLSTQRWLIVKCDTSLELSAHALLISTKKK